MDPASISVDGLFATIRRMIVAGQDVQATFDPGLGYPTELVHPPSPSVSDGDWTESVSAFTSSAGGANAVDTAAVVRAARLAWQRWEPSTYAYVWRQFGPAAGPTSGTAWDVQHSRGRTSTQADPVSDHALAADSSSIAATFASVDRALAAGAWVDLTVDPRSGLPLLAAIDPSAGSSGGESWIRITFTDTQKTDAVAALQAAMDRWATAGLRHFSYTWRYRGDLRPLTYGVTWDNDRSLLRRSPGTPIPETLGYATPRIDDTFRMIQDVLAQGGHVAARYDPVLGYPVRVEVDPNGDGGARGTITITGFVVR